jgi:hypothetical protein
MSEATELQVLFPEGRSVVVDGETFTLTQFKMKHFPLVIELMKKVFDVVTRHTEAKTLQTPQALTEIALAGWSELVALVSVNTGKDIAWVGDLDYDKGLALIIALAEVNIGFFTTKVLPMLNTGMISGAMKNQVMA